MFSIVVKVAAVALLVGIVADLVRAYRHRGAAERPAVGALERAQAAAVVLVVIGMCVGALVDSDVVDDAWGVAAVVALGLTAVRWRRGERALSPWT